MLTLMLPRLLLRGCRQIERLDWSCRQGRGTVLLLQFAIHPLTGQMVARWYFVHHAQVLRKIYEKYNHCGDLMWLFSCLITCTAGLGKTFFF